MIFFLSFFQFSQCLFNVFEVLSWLQSFILALPLLSLLLFLFLSSSLSFLTPDLLLLSVLSQGLNIWHKHSGIDKNYCKMSLIIFGWIFHVLMSIVSKLNILLQTFNDWVLFLIFFLHLLFWDMIHTWIYL